MSLTSKYSSILEDDTEFADNKKNFSTLHSAAKGPLNPNVPVYNKSHTITVGGKPVNAFDQFWQFKQNAGSIFTDWNSAGVNQNYEDMAVKNLPLSGMNKKTPQLVLSNTNNVRNNMQNYSDLFEQQTHELNNLAFKKGLSYESAGTSPYRMVGGRQQLQPNVMNKFNGDKYSTMMGATRVDLPPNYAYTSTFTWQNVNPIVIQPKTIDGNFNQALKTGLLNLNLLKMIGEPCLTKNYNITPPGMTQPADVYSHIQGNPPLQRGLYCSSNTNYVTMPVNYKFPNIDTSFIVSSGTNAQSIGVIMGPKMKHLINDVLFKINKNQVMMQPESDQVCYVKLNNIKEQLLQTYESEANLVQFIKDLVIYKFMGTCIIGKQNIDCSQGKYLLLPSMLNNDLFDLP